ncbi:MAG: MFS transporter [Candidatus Saccharimonadales bacterium]
MESTEGWVDIRMKTMSKRKDLAILAVLNLSGWNSFLFPIWYFFYTNNLGMTPLQSTIFLTISYLFQLLFEVPTGLIADIKGRIFSFRMGMAVIVLSTVPMFLTHNYLILLLSCAVNGLGLALISGCLHPIAHSIFAENYPKEQVNAKLQNYQTKLHTFLFIFRAVCVLAGGIAYVINNYLPLILLISSNIAILLFSFLINPDSKNYNSSSISTHTSKISAFLRKNKNVVYFIALSAFLAMLLNAGWEMLVPVYGTKDLDYLELGIMFAVLSLLSGVFPAIANKIINKSGFKFAVIASLTLSVLSVYIIGHTAYPLNLIVVLTLCGASGPLNVITNSYIQRETPNAMQSTMLSILSSTGMVLSFVITQLDGWLLENFAPVVAAQKLLIPVLIFYAVNLLISRKI